jgi:hypothetical protein
MKARVVLMLRILEYLIYYWLLKESLVPRNYLVSAAFILSPYVIQVKWLCMPLVVAVTELTALIIYLRIVWAVKQQCSDEQNFQNYFTFKEV